MKQIAVTIILTIIPFLVIRGFNKKRYNEKPCHVFTDDEIASLRRLNNLFEDVPLHNGREWKTLRVEELVEVFLTAADSAQKIGEKSKRAIILDSIERCENLSRWMEDNEKRPFYKDSDMSYLVNKPRFVATRLRIEASKL